MGISRLTSFIEENFRGWQQEKIKGYMVVDGCSLGHHLYDKCHLDWSQGGQYPQYQEGIIEFFLTLTKSGIQPIVVCDGIDYTQAKDAILHQRRKSDIRYIHSRMGRLSKEKSFECHGGVLPVLSHKVFREAIGKLGIPLVVVDGEADVAIFQLANYYSCPVLSSDSDFYMYNLKGGYIPVNNLNINTFPVTANVFYVQAFSEQFKYPDTRLRLIVPALVGNDFLPSVRSAKFFAHIKEMLLLDTKECHQLLPLVLYAGSFKSFDEFMSQISSIEGLRYRGMLHENCIKCREMYDSDITQSLDQLKATETTELRKKSGEAIPEWLISQFRDGHLSSFVLDSLVLERLLPRIAVHDGKSSSMHLVSQCIRQYIYGLLGLESVTEHLREGLELVGVRVAAIDSLNGRLLPSLEEVPRLDHGEQKEMLYSMLGCDPSELDKLPEEWRLVAASVVYWTVHSYVPRRLVKALLMCISLCSSKSCDLSEIRRSCRIPRDFRHSSKWIDTVYSFSQWQGCYFASCNLNEVLMKPLKFVSPAFLYDGRIAVYCSIREHMRFPPSFNMTLYKCLLDTITAHTVSCKLTFKPGSVHQKVETASRAQPETAQPRTPQPGTLQPGTPQPRTPQPRTPQPGTLQPRTTQPGTPQPGTPQPRTSQPRKVQPSSAQPRTTQPRTPQPGTLQPRTTQPRTPQPGTLQPRTTQPGTSKPGTPQPGTPQPRISQPRKVQPSSALPRTTQPRTSQPRTPQPRTSQPRTTQPGTSQPRKVRPRTTQPRTLQPRTSQPRTTQPGTSQPRKVRPRTTQPRTSLPGTAHPRTTQPRTSQPRTPQPRTAQPGTRKLMATYMDKPAVKVQNRFALLDLGDSEDQ